MRVEITSCTDTGQVREHNEDCMAHDSKLGIAVLADGMGGYQAGEVASKIAVDTVLSELSASLLQYAKQNQMASSAVINALLKSAIQKANQAILDAATHEPQYRGMGTTIVAAVLKGHELSIAHVGDSRLYRLRHQQLQQLTVDHSVLQELIDCGFYTRAQAQHSPNRHIVTRALGVMEQVDIDVQTQIVLENDLYLLCSDGLNDMLDDEAIEPILNKSPLDLGRMAQELVNLANEHGGSDNISVMLLHLIEDVTLPPQNFWQFIKRKLTPR
ncbi:MAG: hypothetical protein RL368_904 [Pseudomonadota bacterium]